MLKTALQGTAPEDIEKQSYYKALLIVIDAVVAFAHRYADEAEKMAQACQDSGRKNELLQIANNCRRVPEFPPQTYWEALQSFWFTHLMLNLESNAYALSPGRFDQYIDPFYQKDMADKATTKVEAQELLNCLWVKFAEMTVVKEAGTAKASNTYADFQNLNVGGLKADGSDGVNDISYMCIEAQSALLLPQPQLSCLVSSKSPHAFLLKACELARKGTGMPAMFNADGIVLSLAEKGKSLEDARNGGINGCVEITGQGNDQMASSGYINLAKCLELALNNGINMVSGKQLGPRTGTPDQFRSIDDVSDAVLFTSPVYFWGFTSQLKRLIDRGYALVTNYHQPGHTSLMENKRLGLLVTGADAYENNAEGQFTGLSNALIRKNMALLLQTDQDMLVRMPLIPGVNDDVTNLEALGDFLQVHRQGAQLELMPYHRLGEAKYARLGKSCEMGEIPSPSREDVEKATAVLGNFRINLVNR